MNRTHALTAIAATTCTLGFVAALGFMRQPDGIAPPPGPVSDTQPSLTSIDQKLDGLAAMAGGFPPNLQVVDVPTLANNSATILTNVTGTVRIYSFATHSGQAILRDANGNDLASITGGSWRASNADSIGSSQLLLGGLEAQAPLTVVSSGSATGANTFVYYWIEE